MVCSCSPSPPDPPLCAPDHGSGWAGPSRVAVWSPPRPDDGLPPPLTAYYDDYICGSKIKITPSSFQHNAFPYEFDTSPANTKHLYNICTMLDQRRRRWADVVQMLYKCFVFVGMLFFLLIYTIHTRVVCHLVDGQYTTNTVCSHKCYRHRR